MHAHSVFMDTSALFSGVWSSQGGARMLMRLGEENLVQLAVTSQVLLELERTLKDKAPAALPALAQLLDCAHIEVVAAVSEEYVTRCAQLVAYQADAQIVAAAWQAGVAFFATLDKQHILENTALRTAAPFTIGTPGDCLLWFRARL